MLRNMERIETVFQPNNEKLNRTLITRLEISVHELYHAISARIGIIETIRITLTPLNIHSWLNLLNQHQTMPKLTIHNPLVHPFSQLQLSLSLQIPWHFRFPFFALAADTIRQQQSPNLS